MDEPKNFAIISEGYVVNTIWVCENQANEFGAVYIDNPEAGIGWKYINGVFIPPEESNPQSDEHA